MVVVPCRRLWDPRSSRLRRGPSRAAKRHPRDPHLSKKSRGSTIGHSTSIIGVLALIGYCGLCMAAPCEVDSSYRSTGVPDVASLALNHSFEPPGSQWLRTPRW